MNAAKQRRQERRSFIMMTTASEHKIDKVEKMAGGKGHVIIEHLLGEAELDGKCGLYAKVTIEPGCTLAFTSTTARPRLITS